MYLQSLVLQDVSSRPSQIDPRPQEKCKYSNLLKLFFKTKIAIDFCYFMVFISNYDDLCRIYISRFTGQRGRNPVYASRNRVMNIKC